MNIIVLVSHPAGAGEHELVSVLTGQSIGETLQGRVVTHAFSMGGNNATNFSSPIYFLERIWNAYWFSNPK